MVVVQFYIIYHTQSIFIGVLGQLHVLVSFPVTWFLYRVIFQFKYMGMLNFMSMFVILGIGADDIFVFVDAWKQAQLEGPAVNKNLKTRLHWAWNRAASAMLITSLTDGHKCNQHCCRSKNFRGLYGHTCDGELHLR